MNSIKNTKNMTRAALNDDMLTRVTGGNYGDTSRELKNGEPLYKIGDKVEVFVDIFHWFTKTGVIIDRTITNDGSYIYCLKCNTGSTDWAYANDIER